MKALYFSRIFGTLVASGAAGGLREQPGAAAAKSRRSPGGEAVTVDRVTSSSAADLRYDANSQDRGAEGRTRARAFAASAAGMYLSVGIILIYGFSVFIKPIVDTTGWPREAVAAATASVALIVGVMSPVVGALCDRFGPRRVLLVSSLAMPAGFAGIGFFSHDLDGLLIAIAVASLLGSAQTGVPYSQLIVGWFRERRGLALGAVLACGGLGIATLPPLLAWTIAAIGWRAAFVAAGAATALVLFPAAMFLVREPRGLSQASASTGEDARGSPMRRTEFWLMLAAFFLTSLIASAGSISLPLIVAGRGASVETAALSMTIVGSSLVVARIGCGFLLDRVPPFLLCAAAFGAPVLGHGLLATTSSVAPALASAALFGLASGAEGDALAYLLAYRFGHGSFGKLYGINYFAFTLGSGLGAPLLFALAGSGHGFGRASEIAAVAGCIAPALMLLVHVIIAAERQRMARSQVVRREPGQEPASL